MKIFTPSQKWLIISFLATSAHIFSVETAPASKNEWELGPFTRADKINPIISPRPESSFHCPLENKHVQWESGHTFNPAAVVREGKVYLLYRAEDDSGVGTGMHTSRLGLAESSDGLHFQRHSTPVLFPSCDEQYSHEWPGGCEDPRIVEQEDGTYVMMYTQWNRDVAVLAVATSRDLLHWKKHGYAFDQANGSTFGRRWSKSGSVICRCEEDHLVATKIQGKYWMYWGEGLIYLATSDDLISWQPICNESGDPIAFLKPRPGNFDSSLVEAGPPAILTPSGILLLYNGKNSGTEGLKDPKLGSWTYSAGQVLFDANDPTKVLSRADDCFFKPERSYEIKGQYQDGTVFIEGLVPFKGTWLLYYGTADSAIGVAVCPK